MIGTLGAGLPWPSCSSKISINMATTRLQNSPYLCVFNYARAVKQKLWSEAGGGEARALCACETLSFEKKTRLFCSLGNDREKAKAEFHT